jgi:YHS domain-containing protein
MMVSSRSAAIAASRYTKKSRKKEVNKMVKDMICKMEVNEAKAKYVSEYQGKKYYFCAPGCKAEFDRDPDKYAGGD